MKIRLIVALGLLLPCAALAADPQEPAGNYKEYWKRVDGNSDGKVSKDEYQAESARRFQEMDANSDGSATREEMKAYHEKKKAERKALRASKKEKQS